MKIKKHQKTASSTRLLTRNALQQPIGGSVVVPQSRGSTFIHKRVHQQPSNRTSSTREIQHRPTIQHSQKASVHSTNDFTPRRVVQILLKYNKSPTRPPKKYLTNTMTTTTTKKTERLNSNGIPSQSTRSLTSDINKRV